MTRRNQHDLPDDLSYRDGDVLQELYVEQGLKSREIAEMFDVDDTTIRKWMKRNGIEGRQGCPKDYYLNIPVYVSTHTDGYEYAQTQIGGEKEHVYLHRLLAVAEYGIEAVKDKHVHHENKIPWDNRPENIQVLPAGDHIRLHHAED